MFQKEHLLQSKILEQEMKKKSNKEEKAKKIEEKPNICKFRKKVLTVVKRMLLLKLNGINAEKTWKNLKNCKKFHISFKALIFLGD